MYIERNPSDPSPTIKPLHKSPHNVLDRIGRALSAIRHISPEPGIFTMNSITQRLFCEFGGDRLESL
jgi:hypothetical protein